MLLELAAEVVLVAKALKELTDAGFYRVEKIRMPDGTIRSEAHVYDTPQLSVPGVPRPGSGEATTGPAGTPPVKNRYQEPSHPTEQADQPSAGEEAEAPAGREERHAPVQQPPAVPDGQIREAVATLFRVIRPEPRLRLGEAEALVLAPLVAQWMERGSTAGDLAQAMLPGLPSPLHSPVGVLRSRLERKMPPEAPERPPPARYAECAKCHDPVPRPGICGACAGVGPRRVEVVDGAAVAAEGASRVRAAMNAARSRSDSRCRVPAAAI
ncbi:hypothetical protein [Kitasatospora kifunensis]|uniref:Uncharacterized protein n=1 Tax=Kitasatospora kifunensis TaxID=58351 RepID=A0A7W7RAN0_KITKI|nr:hypothetical protein [Kitasatospora kifunensis]MBB4928434.1 hypothetical protein [Kitasatospora kifunensis]